MRSTQPQPHSFYVRRIEIEATSKISQMKSWQSYYQANFSASPASHPVTGINEIVTFWVRGQEKSHLVRMDDLEDSGLEVPSLLLTLELARSLTSGSTHRSESLDLACHNPWVRKDSERQLLKARAETAKPKDSEGKSWAQTRKCITRDTCVFYYSWKQILSVEFTH